MARSMRKLNCVMFKFTISFDAKQFKSDEFRKSVKCDDEDQAFFLFHHNSKFKTKKEHAHLEIFLDDEDSILEMSFHSNKLTDGDVDLPLSDIYIEDVLQELAPFFLEADNKATVISHFVFKKQYESVLKIDYPLLVKNGKLNDATLKGHELSFSDSKVRTGFISTRESGLNVLVGGKIEISLANFNYHDEIKHFAEFARALVIKKD